MGVAWPGVAATPVGGTRNVKRSSPLRRSWIRRSAPKQKREATPIEWARYRGVCPMCLTVGWVEAHHIIPARFLKRHGHKDKLWDTRNRLWAGECCHARHETAVRRFPREFIDRRAEEFAAEIGLTHVLDRFYGKRAA